MGPRPRLLVETGVAGPCSAHKDTARRLCSAFAVGKSRPQGQGNRTWGQLSLTTPKSAEGIHKTWLSLGQR